MITTANTHSILFKRAKAWSGFSGIQNRKCTDNFNIIGDVSILDTRKTTPGLRSFENVNNHRLGQTDIQVSVWPKRWLLPPPTRTAYFSKERRPGVVFLVSKIENAPIILILSVMFLFWIPEKPLQAFALLKTSIIIVWAKPTSKCRFGPNDDYCHRQHAQHTQKSEGLGGFLVSKIENAPIILILSVMFLFLDTRKPLQAFALWKRQ